MVGRIPTFGNEPRSRLVGGFMLSASKLATLKPYLRLSPKEQTPNNPGFTVAIRLRVDAMNGASHCRIKPASLHIHILRFHEEILAMSFCCPRGALPEEQAPKPLAATRRMHANVSDHSRRTLWMNELEDPLMLCDHCSRNKLLPFPNPINSPPGEIVSFRHCCGALARILVVILLARRDRKLPNESAVRIEQRLDVDAGIGAEADGYERVAVQIAELELHNTRPGISLHCDSWVAQKASLGYHCLFMQLCQIL